MEHYVAGVELLQENWYDVRSNDNDFLAFMMANYKKYKIIKIEPV